MQGVVVGQRQAAVAFVGRGLGLTVSRALKKGGWRCMRFEHVRKWVSSSNSKRSLGPEWECSWREGKGRELLML